MNIIDSSRASFSLNKHHGTGQTVMPRLVDLVDEEDGLAPEELEEKIRETDAKKRAVVLEMIG